MHRAEAEKILAAELAAINGGPVTRAADGTITFGYWMRNFYVPMRGANWRDATRRTNLDYLTSHVYPTLEHVPLKDFTKFQVARKTVIPEIEESEKPVLPVEMYAKLLAGLDGIRDRAIFLIACFCALRPSELFGLTWGCYSSSVFTIVNIARRGRLLRKKIKRKNRYGRSNYRLVAIPQAVRKAIDLWRAKCPNADANALMFPGMRVHESHWRRPFIRTIGCACVCTQSRKNWRSHFTLRFRCSAGVSPRMARRKHTPPRCRPNSGTVILVPPCDI
jgi:integrase